MKNLYLTIASLFISLMTIQSYAEGNDFNRGYNGNSFIFVEGGVEFSVFPDGQFDFIFLGNQNSPVTISTPNVAVTYNSGYNYDAYVQYDSYGAVIQVEDVPIFYDYFGRISQAGNVTIRYNNNRLVQVGGLFVHYNPYGYYSHYTGFINPYNRFYTYRPWHAYYAVPYPAYCVVYANPYRTYYTPVRYSYSYHRDHYNKKKSYTNGRRDFHRPGSREHYKDGRVAANSNFNSGRSNQAVASTTYRRDDTVLRSSANTRNNSNTATRRTSTASGNDNQQRGTPANSNTSRNANVEYNAPVTRTNAASSESRQTSSPAVRVNSTVRQTNNTAVRNSPTARQTYNTVSRDSSSPVRNTSITTPARNRNVQQAPSRSQNTSATRANSTNSRAATSSRGGRG